MSYSGPADRAVFIASQGDLLLSGWGTGPDGARARSTFTKHIVWIRSTETQIRLAHRGHLVDERSTYVDVGRFLSSLTSAVECGLDLAGRLEVDDRSSLVIEAVTRILDTPHLPLPAGAEPKFSLRSIGRHQEIPHDVRWWIADATLDADAPLPLLEAGQAIPEQVLWSTKMKPTDSIAGVEQLLSRWSADKVSADRGWLISTLSAVLASAVDTEA